MIEYDNPYDSTRMREYYSTLYPLLDLCQNMPSYELVDKMGKLLDLLNTIPPKRTPLVNFMIYNIKKIINSRPQQARKRINRRDHQLTDHAFCRVLELIIGHDMISLKDKAMSEIQNQDKYSPLIKDGLVITLIENYHSKI